MAFVFGKAKKDRSFRSSSSPGPGDYIYNQKKSTQHVAPFNCSSIKTSVFDIDLSKQTGPGSYNPLCQKQLQSDKAMRMTSSFSSKIQRFKAQTNEKPQLEKEIQVKLVSDTPYRYNPTKSGKSLQKELFNQVINRVKEKVTKLQENNRLRKSESIGGNKYFVRVVLSNPKNTQILHSVFMDSSIIKKVNGPGSYNISNPNNIGKGINVVDWSRNTVQRFKSQKNKYPGPGSYMIDQKIQKLNRSLSAAFAFQGLRSHIDQVVYRTKMPFKVKVIEQKKLKDRYPGPGTYEPQKINSKSFHYGEDRFRSTQYDTHQSAQVLPGPGYYNAQQTIVQNQVYKQKLKQNRQKIFGKNRIKTQKVQTLCDLNKEEVRKQCLIEIQRTANKFYSLQERCSSKIGNFSHANRWKQLNKKSIPGPGQYKVQVKSNDQRVIKNNSHGFNSAVGERSYFLEHSFNTPFYEVDRSDMGKRALRVRKNIQNLKQIEIEKAPFNSKQKRFCSENKIVNRSVTLDGCEINSFQQQVIGTSKVEKIKKVAHQPHLTSQFKSKTKRSWVYPCSFIGPGDYQYISSLQKKSFNQEYNYCPPVKIRSTYRTRSSVA